MARRPTGRPGSMRGPLGRLAALVGLLACTNVIGVSTAAACTGCGIDGAQMAEQATTIELMRYAGPAGMDPDTGPLARFRVIEVLKGRRVASIRYPVFILDRGHERQRQLMLRVPNWGEMLFSVSADGRLEPWADGEGEPGPYPLTLSGWRALIASLPETATAPALAQRRTPDHLPLLMFGGVLGGGLAARRVASRAGRRTPSSRARGATRA